MIPASRPARNQARFRPLLVVLLAALLGLTLLGCGKSKETADKPDSQPTEGGKKLAALWPLTGLPVDGSTPDHPVLVVKIDNSPSSRPQVGLSKADLVTEELVEGGITRLAVAFYSQLPKDVGPVRSMRASDIGIVKPTHGVLVASGGAPPTLGRLNGEHIKYYTEGGPGYYRSSSRRSPYNLMVHLDQLAKKVRKAAVVPASYLPWGADTDFVGTAPATKIQAKFSAGHTTSFAFRGGNYVNVNSNATASDEYKPQTVLVLRVQVGDAGYRDPAGNPVPETIYKGNGNMAMFHNGQVVQGSWTKTAIDSQIQLTDANGAQLKVPAGKVWIELVPVQPKGGNLAFQP